MKWMCAVVKAVMSERPAWHVWWGCVYVFTCVYAHMHGASVSVRRAMTRCVCDGVWLSGEAVLSPLWLFQPHTQCPPQAKSVIWGCWESSLGG